MSFLISAMFMAPALLGQAPPLPSPHPELSAFPQTAPLLSTLRWCYSLGRAEGEPGSGRSGLRAVTIRGIEGAMPPGAATVDGALIRSAFGLRAWGEDLKQRSWIEASDKMMALVAASGVIAGDSSFLPGGLRSGPPEMLQGIGYAVLFAHRFPASPASESLKSQTDAWITQRLDGRSPLSINELGSLALASQAWELDAAPRVRLSERLLPAAARLAREVKSLDEKLALAQALLDGRSLLSKEQHLLLDDLVSSLLSEAWSLQLDQDDQRTYPIPTRGLFGAAGERPAWEAWHVSTLLQAGSLEPTPDKFRKGVMMLRALMGLVSQPTGSENGLYQDDLFIGRMAPTPWMLARAGADSWPGFALAEGQFMTSLYHIHQRHGSIYHSSRGWKEGVDAVLLTKEGPISLLRQLSVPYSGAFELTEVAGANRVHLQRSPSAPLAVRPPELFADADGLKLVADPTFVQTPNRPLNPSGEFTLPDQSVKEASLGSQGFEMRLDPTKPIKGEVRFTGKAGGTTFSSSSSIAWDSPSSRADWTLMGGAAYQGSETVDGIAGTGSPKQKGPRGAALSRPFLKGLIKLEFTAGPGSSVWIEDALTGEPLRKLQSGSARSALTLDFTLHKSHLLRIRLLDQSEKSYAAVYSISVK